VTTPKEPSKKKVKLSPAERKSLIDELLADYYDIVKRNPNSPPKDILTAIATGRRGALSHLDPGEVKLVSKGVERELLSLGVDAYWDLPTHYQVAATKTFKLFIKERAKDPNKVTKDSVALSKAFAKAFKLPDSSDLAVTKAMMKDKYVMKAAKKLVKKLDKMGYDLR
jgi:hypothetical protein